MAGDAPHAGRTRAFRGVNFEVADSNRSGEETLGDLPTWPRNRRGEWGLFWAGLENAEGIWFDGPRDGDATPCLKTALLDLNIEEGDGFKEDDPFLGDFVCDLQYYR